MTAIKLVLTDIDGTLVPIGSSTMSPAVHASLQAVQAAGIPVVAATGRPYEMARPLFTSFGFSGLGIFDGGATIRAVETGDLAWQNWLSVDRLRAIVAIVLPHCTYIDYAPTWLELDPAGVSIDDVVEPAPYVAAFIQDAAFPAVRAQLEALGGLNIHVGPRHESSAGLVDLQVTDKQATKFHAVNELRKLVHSTKAHTLAIGDSANDLPLFQNAGVTVAMGNATPEVKDAADYHVASVDADGFAEAMQRFVLGSDR